MGLLPAAIFQNQRVSHKSDYRYLSQMLSLAKCRESRKIIPTLSFNKRIEGTKSNTSRFPATSRASVFCLSNYSVLRVHDIS